MAGATRAAEEVRRGLRTHIGEALHNNPDREDWKALSNVLDEAAASFWSGTELHADRFFDAVNTSLSDGIGLTDHRMSVIRENFAVGLKRTAVAVFDEIVASSVMQDPVRVYGRRLLLHNIPRWQSVRNAMRPQVPEVTEEPSKETKAKANRPGKTDDGKPAKATGIRVTRTKATHVKEPAE